MPHCQQQFTFMAFEGGKIETQLFLTYDSISKKKMQSTSNIMTVALGVKVKISLWMHFVYGLWKLEMLATVEHIFSVCDQS